MALPIDLILVRHGQSEGNLAKRRSEKGDNSAYTEEFRNRHTASYRLTPLGREQAQKAGAYLKEEFYDKGEGFDKCFTSEYTRAMETSALLNLPKAKWYCDFYITERDWGDLDSVTEDEKEGKFAEAMKKKEVEPFFWRPPNGESFAQLCLRIDRLIYTLHRECSDKRVVVVCHGEVMRAFQVRLERMSQVRFKELNFSEEPKGRIHNCQIIHYTRRNPHTGELAPYANWVRWVRATENPIETSDWQDIKRPTYTNEELLEVVHQNKLMVE